jgi:GTP-binding protein LepA
VDILLNGEMISDLSFFVHKNSSYLKSKEICEDIKEKLQRQNFTIPIQACIGKRVIARETIKALRKDVTDYLYGGDRTRKMKL